jgi:hypothetical protein
MHTFRHGIFAAVAFMGGCTGSIGAPSPGEGGPSEGSGANVGSGATGSGATNGSGAANGKGGATGKGGNGSGSNVGSGGSGNTGSGGTGSGPLSNCAVGIPGTSQLPRLTGVQYDNTIRDLVGIDSQPSTLLAPDSPGSVDQRAWDGYQAAAAAVAEQVMANAAARAQAIPCSAGADEAGCVTQFIESFGQRAFRRPLTSAETARFQQLYTDRAAITATGSFDEVAGLILKAFLLSPSFLTRGEIAEVAEGQYFALSPYEVASRLSYMLWGSMPDDQLFAAAASNSLSTPAGILTEAQRMLQSPKARTRVAAFHRFYAHMGPGTRWTAAIQREPAYYPLFKESMIPALSEETARLFEHITFEQGGSFQDLLTTPLAYVNAALAPIYGLDPSAYGNELVQVTLDATKRPGIFTRAGFLTAYSLYNRPSAILRGAFIQKDLLCTEIGSPPPNAESTPQPTEGLLTNRERTDAQTQAATCAGCHHTLINPTGFVMEAYDAIGAWQTAEKENGAAINTASSVPLNDDSYIDVAGPADLMHAIAASPEGQRCYAQKWVQFAYERAVNPQDACTVDSLATKLTSGGYTILNLVADLTQSESFRLRAKEVAQ